MQGWEYKTILRELKNAYWTVEMGEELDKLGVQGWELVAAYPVDLEIRVDSPGTQRSVERRERWVFKRPIPEHSQSEASLSSADRQSGAH